MNVRVLKYRTTRPGYFALRFGPALLWRTPEARTALLGFCGASAMIGFVCWVAVQALSTPDIAVVIIMHK